MTSTPPTPEVLAAAAARRNENSGSGISGARLIQEHERRQTFRRLIDPGIFRPNSKEVAMSSLKTLSTIAENLLREPDNPKYQMFKRENEIIKRRLVEPKGTLEYAVELGFSPKVMDLQSFYVFNPKKMEDLRVGAHILKEALELETEKQERARLNKEGEKAAAEAAAQKVKLAFLDDRRSKMSWDERERQLREAREGAQQSPPSPPQDNISRPMPGTGFTLSSVPSMEGVEGDPDVDLPPPYPATD